MHFRVCGLYRSSEVLNLGTADGPDPISIKSGPIEDFGSDAFRRFYVCRPPPRSTRRQYCDEIWAVGSARAGSNGQDLMFATVFAKAPKFHEFAQF